MIERLIPAGPRWTARIRFSDRSHGDFGGNERDRELDACRQAFMDGPWTWLNQVHGAEVVAVDRPGQGAGTRADGAVTTRPGAVLAVQTADCAPVVIVGPEVIGIVHAGWRGIVAGVVGAVADAVRTRMRPGDYFQRAVMGPVIRPRNYEIGPADLDAVVAVAGDEVRAATAWGTPALDLAAAVRAGLKAAGVGEVDDLGLDTAEDRFFSHRIRGERGRLATAVRLEPS